VFVTSLPVFCEIHARFSRLPRHRRAVIADFWKNPVARVELPTHDDAESANELLEQHHDKNFSYCDALSFVVMRRMGLRQAASFDIHFRQFGEFEVIC
jgi:predicted nucleic acid-binding protein